MHHTDSVIEIAAGDGEAGVASLDGQLDQVQRGVFHIESDHGGAGCHDVIRAGVAELQRAVQHAGFTCGKSSVAR